LQEAHTRESEVGDCLALLHHKFFCKELWDGDAESLLVLTPFMPHAISSVFVMPL
jgi:hypothetical protein